MPLKSTCFWTCLCLLVLSFELSLKSPITNIQNLIRDDNLFSINCFSPNPTTFFPQHAFVQHLRPQHKICTTHFYTQTH
jgi:hypothetical protein